MNKEIRSLPSMASFNSVPERQRRLLRRQGARHFGGFPFWLLGLLAPTIVKLVPKIVAAGRTMLKGKTVLKQAGQAIRTAKTIKRAAAIGRKAGKISRAAVKELSPQEHWDTLQKRRAVVTTRKPVTVRPFKKVSVPTTPVKTTTLRKLTT